MANRKILLVEDDPNDVELTMMALEEYRLTNEIVVLRDGVEALDYLWRRGAYTDRPEIQPVLILLDIKMPKVDGLEVLRQIKADPALRHIPVVMLTSSAEEQDVLESYNLGINAYVVKPVAFQAFMDAVKRLGLFWVVTNKVPSSSTSS